MPRVRDRRPGVPGVVSMSVPPHPNGVRGATRTSGRHGRRRIARADETRARRPDGRTSGDVSVRPTHPRSGSCASASRLTGVSRTTGRPCSREALQLHADGTNPGSALPPLAITRCKMLPSPLGDGVGHSNHDRFRGYLSVVSQFENQDTIGSLLGPACKQEPCSLVHLLRRHWPAPLFAWTATRSRNREARRGIIEAIRDNQ